MKSSNILRWIQSVTQLVPTFVFLLLTATPLVAQEKYFATSRPDGITLLAPPPIPGSAEYVADLASARSVFKGRSPKEEAKAIKLSKLTIFNFAPAIGDFFEPGKLPKTEALFQNLKPEIKVRIDAPKKHWHRQRPYEVDSTLSLGEPESSFSYPSGHSTVGMTQALLLAEIFPEKRDAIVAIGRDIGWARVVIGKHFPTDVHAGRVLAQAIVRELLASPNFQKELAEVKAEVLAAQN